MRRFVATPAGPVEVEMYCAEAVYIMDRELSKLPGISREKDVVRQVLREQIAEEIAHKCIEHERPTTISDSESGVTFPMIEMRAACYIVTEGELKAFAHRLVEAALASHRILQIGDGALRNDTRS